MARQKGIYKQYDNPPPTYLEVTVNKTADSPA